MGTTHWSIVDAPVAEVVKPIEQAVQVDVEVEA
jgi:hypothetical protein